MDFLPHFCMTLCPFSLISHGGSPQGVWEALPVASHSPQGDFRAFLTLGLLVSICTKMEGNMLSRTDIHVSVANAVSRGPSLVFWIGIACMFVIVGRRWQRRGVPLGSQLCHGLCQRLGGLVVSKTHWALPEPL